MMMGVIHMSLVLILWPIINFSWNSVMSVFPSYSGDAHAYLPGVCVQVAESQTPGDSCKALSFLGFFHRYSMLYLHLYFYEVKCLFFKYSMDHLELTQQLVAGKTEPIFFTSVWSVLLTHPSTPTSLLLRLINVVLTFIPFEGPDTMKHVALDCNKALYGVFAVWKLLWKLTCSIIRNYLEFSASFSFICESGRNQHVETKNVFS